jgi:hypothetical protein
MTLSKSASTGTAPRAAKSTKSTPHQSVLMLRKEDQRGVKKQLMLGSAIQ